MAAAAAITGSGSFLNFHGMPAVARASAAVTVSVIERWPIRPGQGP